MAASQYAEQGTERTPPTSKRPNCSSHFWRRLARVASWWWARSNRNSKPHSGVRWDCPRCTSYCIGITGANLHLINGTRKATLKLKRTGKKTPRKTRGNPQRLGTRRTDLPDVPRRGTLWAYQRRAPLLGSQTNTSFMSGHADSRIYLRLCCRRAAQWHT